MISARDIREFRGFLRNATDRQVQGIYDKEARAGRDEYAELAVEEADRRGIYLERENHARKKSPAQLDREIAQALGQRGRSHARVGGSPQQAWDVSLDGHVIDTVFYDPDVDADYVRRGLINHDGYDSRIKVRRAPRRSSASHATIGGTRSLVDAIRAGDRVTIVDRFGQEHTGRAVMRGPHGWVLNMGGKHGTPGIASDENIVKVKTSGKKSHATIKSAVPAIGKWATYAGGTGAAEGKHSYDYKTGIKGEYHIMPYTTRSGRHAGYSLRYAATGGQPRGGSGGLWHDLGTYRSPASAAKAAREHYTKSFD